MDAARELRQQMKGEKEMQSCVDRLKRNCKELEDEIEDIEGKVKDLYRCLINVRMTLLGILSQA
jgi:prefoldin subunit 5